MNENSVLFGDFNMSITNANLNNSMSSFDLDSLIGLSTCCKSTNRACNDLPWTSKNNHYINFVTFKSVLSDHNNFLERF